MNFDWLFKKRQDFPDFWNDYINSFKKNKNVPITNTRFVAFDTETTGFDKKEDRILSIGAVSFVGKTIQVNNSLELYLDQDVFKPETVKIHGLMKTGSQEKISELEAIKAFLLYIKSDILVAHHANFDRNMVNEMLLRHGLGKLKNKFIDTGVLYKKSIHIIYRQKDKSYSLDDLAKELNVPTVDRHTATGDALITALVFLKTIARLNKHRHLNWSNLLDR
ncbi:DNA polymerase III PolC-type [Mariniflexile rhizosphaerae]|uniref:3'-5' exonuclease n=1 Tax=unclassified Mariniflexile TaxID=2643887 RepID=UPI000CB91314|nr:3'-5' exonuclease [Mariniflexile sp. TRM1-10]AXP82884.1 DNA polymerase III PolC-type [Mariniflexile sp. TRM1-10]PLB18205.1 MAG: DNA polymerase III, epsilon subunit [Flavobacteriaceae bacterium FS1-H7996/R]